MLVKMCGFTNTKDTKDALQFGADFIGLIFYEKSKRNVDVAVAIEIVKEVKKAGKEAVAVFVDADAEKMRAICEETGIRTVQLHGDVARKEHAKLPAEYRKIFAVSVDADGVYSEEGLCGLDTRKDYLLFDGKTAGSGQPFPWKKFTPPRGFRYLLGGGLTSANVEEAISILSPDGVDVASGIERDYGQKDHAKMKEFMQKALSKKGYYGSFGGAFIPEGLPAPIAELERCFHECWNDAEFRKSFTALLEEYAGRATPLTEVPNFSARIGGPRIFLKREDLLHTGAHKLNNALGQCLLAKAMGKTRVIAETGAGQHGVATATACARLGLQCVIYMGKKDMIRQEPNVFRMRLLGAEVVAVENGAKTLKDAVNEALRDWGGNYDTTHYCLGSALGPHPFPEMVAAFQSVIGKEVKEEFQRRFGKNPDVVVACIGGGSNAIGIFSAFVADENVQLIGVEAGGKGLQTNKHAARFNGGRPGVLHGCYTYVLQDKEGQIADTDSISAGLDYPAIGPHHAQFFEERRVKYGYAVDEDVLVAFRLLAETEGIIPALESSHALAYVMKEARNMNHDQMIVINLSGRGDKDLPHLIETGALEIKS